MKIVNIFSSSFIILVLFFSTVFTNVIKAQVSESDSLQGTKLDQDTQNHNLKEGNWSIYDGSDDFMTATDNKKSVLNIDDFLGDYIGTDMCNIAGESESYRCTIFSDKKNPNHIFIGNMSGFNLPIKAIVQDSTHFIIPNQSLTTFNSFGKVDFIFEGSCFAILIIEIGNIGICYRVTCVGCGENGDDVVDECYVALIRQ